MWITLIKLTYAPLRCLKTSPDIHPAEYLYGRLLPSVRWVSEKNSSGIRGVLNLALGKYVSSGSYAELGYRLSSPLERWQRVVECSGLEARYAAEADVGGSNPPLSASYMVALW